MEQHSDERTAASTRFAPWWVYLGAILGTNYLRKAIVGEPSEPSLAVAGGARVLRGALRRHHSRLPLHATAKRRRTVMHRPRDNRLLEVLVRSRMSGGPVPIDRRPRWWPG